MGISISSLIITIIITATLIYLINILLKIEKLAVYMRYKYLILIYLFIFIRLTVPFEWKWSITIPSQNVMPTIYKILFTTIPGTSITIGLFFLIIWLSIFLVKILYLFKEIILLHRTFHKNTNLFEKVEIRSFSFIADTLKERIFYSQAVKSPKLVNVLKPCILLPNIDYTEEELRYILLHEIQHIKNWDLLTIFFVELLECFYWWLPPVYVLKKQINFLIEIRVDYQVTKNLSKLDQLDYMKTLVTVKKKINDIAKDRYYSLAIENNFYQERQSLLSRRIDLFLKEKRSNKIVFFLPVVFCLLLIPFFIFEPYSIDQTTNKTSFNLNENTEKYILETERGTYYLYENDKKLGIINNPKEVPFNELDIYHERSKK